MHNDTLTIALILALVVAVATGIGGNAHGVPPSGAISPPEGTPPPVSPGTPGDGYDVPPSEPPINEPGISQEDKLLLARLIRAEAEGEPFLCQVAVGATVLNRVKSPLYPDTIPEVIYQVESGYWQYEVVQNGRINIPPDSTSLAAADEAIRGEDPSYGAIGFYNPSQTSNAWVLSRPVTTAIGNLVFYR
ncbi:MAG TPA: hypothetical protein GX509_05865 [Firmicutes bacterium]|nr:hypothetical protein [Bacillota bacterium]HHY98246.1 hypothetical protein [Bacillota bacterium]